MTKYREIPRLSSLGLSQQSIADSCNESKKTMNRVLKRAKRLQLYWPLEETKRMQSLQKNCFLLYRVKFLLVRSCPTSTTSRKSCSVAESTKSFSGQNTWRNVDCPAKVLSCILSSAITYSRMSRNAVQPCTLTASPANRLR